LARPHVRCSRARAPSGSVRLADWGIFVACLAPALGFANNGLNLIGYGAESTGMAGSDIAIARDTMALNTNPAGLVHITGSALDLSAAAAYGLDVGHQDVYGNDARVTNHWIPVGNMGYALRLGGSGITVGAGMFAQGGAGNNYKHLNTAFGTNDDLSGIFGAAKLTAGFAWRADAKLSLGASISLVHAEARQKIFPGTSFFNALNPPASFYGLQLKNAAANNFGFKAGLQYAATDELTLAATYTTATSLKLKNGTLVVNMSAIGLGGVTYQDASINGLGFPQEVAIGAALKQGRTTWAIKLGWLDWARAMKSSTLTATAPDNPLAPPVISQTQNNDWKSQFVVAVGLAHDLDERTTLWAGYNYGRNPIPTQNTNPLLAAINEQHLTFGASRRLDNAWRLGGGIEFAPLAKVTYTNPALPFGPNAVERNSYIAFNLTLSRRW
jgi:long-chain fatty acid transport protein